MTSGRTNSVNHTAAIRHCINSKGLTSLSCVDRVAELMAQGCNSEQIMEICGYRNVATANAQIQRIRREMGVQAQ